MDSRGACVAIGPRAAAIGPATQDDGGACVAAAASGLPEPCGATRDAEEDAVVVPAAAGAPRRFQPRLITMPPAWARRALAAAPDCFSCAPFVVAAAPARALLLQHRLAAAPPASPRARAAAPGCARPQAHCQLLLAVVDGAASRGAASHGAASRGAASRGAATAANAAAAAGDAAHDSAARRSIARARARSCGVGGATGEAGAGPGAGADQGADQGAQEDAQEAGARRGACSVARQGRVAAS